MVRTTSIILGLAFLALGFLGIAGVASMFNSGSIYVNIIEIALGALGFVVGIFAPKAVDSNKA